MRNFQDTFETRKQSFISAFSVCMTVHLILEAKFSKDPLGLKGFNNVELEMLWRLAIYAKNVEKKFTTSCLYQSTTLALS